MADGAAACRSCGQPAPDPEKEERLTGPGGVVEPGWRAAVSGPLFARRGVQEQLWVAGHEPATPPLLLSHLGKGLRLEIPPKETRKYWWEPMKRMGPCRLVTPRGSYVLKSSPDALEKFFKGLGVEVKETVGKRRKREVATEKFLLRLGWVICMGFLARDVVSALQGSAPGWWIGLLLLLFAGALAISWYYTRFRRPWAVSSMVAVLVGVCWAYFGLAAA